MDLDTNLDNALDGEQTPDNEVENFTFGEKTYSKEEMERLVRLGEIGLEAEEKYNTKIDKVWPEFSKTKNQIKTYEQQLEELKNASQVQQPQVPADEAEQIAQAKAAAKKLGILTRDDLEELGIVTKNDFNKLVSQWDSGKELLNQARSLETKYDGSDGRPSFDTEDMLEYMQETGIKDPEVAYKVRYDEQIEKWNQEQLNKAKKPGFSTQESGGGMGKSPKNVQITKANLGDLIDEELGL